MIKSYFHSSIIKILSFLLIILIYYSCSNSDKTNNNQIDKHIKVEFIEDHPMKTSDYFSSIEFIPLKTEDKNLVKTIRNVVIYDNHIYTCPGYPDTRINVYDFNGLNTYSINKFGEGPGEIKNTENIDIYDSMLLILDRSQMKIVFCDLNGQFIKEQKLKSFYSSFLTINDTTFALYKDAPISGSEDSKLSIIIYDSSYIKQQIYSEKTIHPELRSIMSGISTMFINDQQIYNYESYSDSILIHDLPHLKYLKCIKLDFGKYKAPMELLQLASSPEMVNSKYIHELIGSEYVFIDNYKLCNNENQVFSFGMGFLRNYFGINNIEDATVKVYTGMSLDLIDPDIEVQFKVMGNGLDYLNYDENTEHHYFLWSVFNLKENLEDYSNKFGKTKYNNLMESRPDIAKLINCDSENYLLVKMKMK